MVRARRWWVAVPVVQTPDPADVATELAQRRSVLHGGTLVSAGTAEVVVVATNDRTELGRISVELRLEPPTATRTRRGRGRGRVRVGPCRTQVGKTAWSQVVRAACEPDDARHSDRASTAPAQLALLLDRTAPPAGVLGRVGRASSTSSSARVRARCHADHPAVLVGKGHGSTSVEFLLQASAALPDGGPGELAAGLATARAEMEERPWTLPSGRHRAGQRGLAVSALLIAVAVDHVVLGPLKRLDRPTGAAEEAGSVMPRASVAAAQVVSSRVVVVVTHAVHRSRPVRRTSARDSYGASEGER